MLRVCGTHTASADLIPTVVKAFKEKSSAQQLRFRPLHLRFINAPLNFRFHELWSDAADRRVRPCPHCSHHVVGDMDSDRYHFVSGREGLRLTIELSYLWTISCAGARERYGPWKRLRERVRAMRVVIDRGNQCSRPLPKGPERELLIVKQPEILEDVFHFAARDNLDTYQLVCRHFHKFVDGRGDALALRPFYDVLIGTEWRYGEWLVRINQASRLSRPGRMFAEQSSLTSADTVLSILRNGCALILNHVPHSPSVLQSLLDKGVRFAAKMGELQCFNASHEELLESLLRMSTLGVTEFHFRMQEVGWMRVLTSQALAGAMFVSCRILPGLVDQPTLNEIQQLADEFLRNSPAKRVSFLMPTFCPVVHADRIIEPEFWEDGIPVPYECRHPPLRNVVIPANVLVRHVEWRAPSYDVCHLQNARTKEHLTVCLGKREDGSVGFIFIENVGRTRFGVGRRHCGHEALLIPVGSLNLYLI